MPSPLTSTRSGSSRFLSVGTDHRRSWTPATSIGTPAASVATNARRTRSPSLIATIAPQSRVEKPRDLAGPIASSSTDIMGHGPRHPPWLALPGGPPSQGQSTAGRHTSPMIPPAIMSETVPASPAPSHDSLFDGDEDEDSCLALPSGNPSNATEAVVERHPSPETVSLNPQAIGSDVTPASPTTSHDSLFDEDDNEC